MSGQAAALLSALQAAGVHVALSAAGNTLELTGKRPPAALLDEVRASKAALLEALAPANREDVAPKTECPPAARSFFAADLARTPGHCGSCARWIALPAPLAHIGLCSAGRAAHGWYDGNPVAPVELQAGHGCAAHGGKGWKAIQRMQTPPGL